LALSLKDENERLLVQVRVAGFHDEEYARRDSLLGILDERIPDNLIVLVTKAYQAEYRGDRRQAEALWRRILEVNPNFAHAYNTLGYAAAMRGSYDEAVGLLQKYTYLAPDVANAHDSLGEILTFTGQYEEAEQEFRKALELQSDFYASLVNLARIYIALGRVEKGLEIMRKTGESLEGSDVELRYLYLATQTYISYWMPAELEQVARRFIQLYPDEGYSASLRIFLTTFNGEFETAKALADSLVTSWHKERFPRLTEPAKSVYESFADRFAALIASYEGRPEAAAAAWEQAVNHAAPLAPHELIAYRVPYAWTLAELGRNLDALVQAQEVLQTNPRVISALVIQAQTLLALNELEKAAKALEVLEKALAVADPDYPPVGQTKALKKKLASRMGS